MWVYQKGKNLSQPASPYSVKSAADMVCFRCCQRVNVRFCVGFRSRKWPDFGALGFFKRVLLAHVNPNFWQFSLVNKNLVRHPVNSHRCGKPNDEPSISFAFSLRFSLPLHMSWQRDALARWGANGMPLPPFNQDIIGAAFLVFSGLPPTVRTAWYLSTSIYCQNADQRHRISSVAFWGVVNLYGNNMATTMVKNIYICNMYKPQIWDMGAL